MAALSAAAHPAQTSYLYFVVKPCGNQQSVFSTNYQQFLSDSARYQAARTANGGRSPTHC
jgi:cell division protein YceG involved in septum cleavage